MSFIFISKIYLKKKIAKICGIGALIVVTGSMEPTINIKEMIIIKEQKNYKIGDIVTYTDDNQNLVTHRIVSKTGSTVITRGDNNTVNDKPITINRIEGKVYYHSSVLGEIVLYWVKPILFLSISFLFLGIIKSIILYRRESINENKI